jgi:acyl-CoA reductase-like NAD-dependent aldehyde dehydrogenase
MQPEYDNVAVLTAPSVNEVIRESYGVVFIIGPFNYPVFCTVGIPRPDLPSPILYFHS